MLKYMNGIIWLLTKLCCYVYGGMIDMKNTIAIIGGTGRAGRFLVKTAKEEGYRVRMLVRTPKKSLLDDPNFTRYYKHIYCGARDKKENGVT